MIRRRTLRWFLVTLGALTLGVSSSLCWYWPNIAGWVRTQHRHQRYLDGCDPLARELAGGSIGPGSSIEDVLAKYPPGRVTRHGHYTTIETDPGPLHRGIILIAIDGKLVFAVDTDLRPAHIFFETISEPELVAALSSYETECDRQWRARNAAFVAVVGVPATIRDIGDDRQYLPPLPDE